MAPSKNSESEEKIKQTMKKLAVLAEDPRCKCESGEKKVFLQQVTNPKDRNDTAYVFKHRQYALARVNKTSGVVLNKQEIYGEIRTVLTAGGEGELAAFDLFSKSELDTLGELLPYIKNDVAVLDLARDS
ncbi:hypothetical protein BFW01_g4539 [Lasiodiplodia theobromae]|uniref:MerR family transcriptional regulator n=1 Tax=Lasiodiplodia theobromae TaxID=45133 RepID=UPI0015C31499|nr:MerR family transcriptional regulator [Lasiodiplodia theobromae]KAF4537117.1 MerR family transcriptional regulator [Lasiodiplodia theobromae]KAF9633645.1 hypothetical protein BFW01_g4539 [Lasiodiplodia theobromae]